MPNPRPSMPGEYRGMGGGAEVSKSPNRALGSLQVEMPSELEMLKQKKEALEYELEKVAAAIGALEAHPDIEEVMRLVRRAL